MGWLDPRAWRHHVRRLAADWRWAGDRATLRQLYRSQPDRQALQVRCHGQRLRITVRGRTVDTELARAILCEASEYRLPVDLDPQVIFDVGANIGMTALYFACAYPRAHIFCFEPLPDNLELLRLNAANFPDRITVIPKGLGDHEATLPYHPSSDPRNFGGGGFFAPGCDTTQETPLPVTTVDHAAAELGIEQVDLFKLDTEGAEASILAGTSDTLIQRAEAFIGELHGVDDFAFLQRLDRTHEVGLTKPHDRRCYPFVAIRRAASAQAAVATPARRAA